MRQRGAAWVVPVFDLGTQTATLLFDVFSGPVLPYALDDGHLYFSRGDALVRSDVGSCSSETAALVVGADRITAVAVDGPDVFWADLYSTPITGSRVHLVRPGIPERLLLELDGEVTSIVLDALNMYVALRHVGTTRRTLVRTRRP